MSMSYGSTHVWDYDDSPEEYLSDSELEGSSEEELEDSGTYTSPSSHVPVKRTTSKQSLYKQLRYSRIPCNVCVPLLRAL